MSDIEPDAADTLETKFHAFVESLTPEETELFGDLLLSWHDEDVAGFGADVSAITYLLKAMEQRPDGTSTK